MVTIARALLGLVALVAFAALGAAGSTRAQSISGCPVFPTDNPWNRDISNDPLDPNSTTYINTINQSRQFLHPDFGSDPTFGIPFVVVPGNQPLVPITFDAFGDQSDPGPYPFPPNAPVESGSDGHSLVVASGACVLYELYQARKDPVGPGWTAGSGAKFDLHSNALRPDGWTSADAAGLPIFPGLARYDEVNSGVINHALRFTVPQTQHGYIHPATHFASNSANTALPPMGLRLRLKASYDISQFTGNSRVILTALKRYGMMVADNGSAWFISGSTDTRWNDSDLNHLKTVPGNQFEVVQSGPILGQLNPTPTPVVTPTRTPTRTPTPPAICTPRPPVTVSVAVTGGGRLQATVTAQASANARLLSLAFGTARDAVVDVPGGPTGTAGNVTVPLSTAPQQIVLTVRRVQSGQGVTVPLTVNDSCGAWPTFVGAGPAAFGEPPAAPPTGTPGPAAPSAPGAPAGPAALSGPAGPAAPSTPAGPATPSSTLVPTPTAAPICAPRPPLGVATVPGAPGQLQVTLTAPASANDWLVGVRVASATNATLDVNGQPGLGSGGSASFPVGTRQAMLTLRRLAPGQAATVSLAIADSCGDWPTILGGGPSAF
ncbi:MAG TPA: hypothetical protein VII06_42800 [Chloroflexota bacterium]